MQVKKWSLSMSLLIIFTIVLGQVGKSMIKEVDVSNIQEFSKLNCRFDYIYGIDKQDEKVCYNSFKEYEADYIQDAKDAENVMIGTFTGDIDLDGTAMGMWVTVNKCLKGGLLKEGDKIPIYQDCLLSFDEQGNAVYNSTINIMKKGEKYLIFYEPSELNVYQEQKEYRFTTSVNYYKLTETTSIPVDSKKKRLNDVWDNEFFASSDRIIEQLEKIKKEVISYYLL